MDIGNIKPQSDTIEVFITHPQTGEIIKNDDGSEMTITLYAPHSQEYRSASYNQQNKYLKALQGNKKNFLSAEDVEKSIIELYANVTKSWDITYGGEKPKLTTEKAKEIYRELFWLRDQLAGALDESVGFTKA